MILQYITPVNRLEPSNFFIRITKLRFMMSVYVDLLQEYREKFDKEIFPLLVSHELIHKKTGLVYHSFQKRIDRIELQKKSIENKIFLLKQHMADGNKVEDFDKSIMFDLITMFAQGTLSYFENIQIMFEIFFKF